MVETAIAHAWRWRRFSLFADWFVPTFNFIDRFEKIYVPNLEYFALCISSIGNLTIEGIASTSANMEDRGKFNPLILTGGAPGLRTVRLDTTSRFHSLPPLSNITTLAIQDTPGLADNPFPFHIFHSILTIPTLTNLSIEMVESDTCVDYTWINGHKNLPRIIMPSLKTLRIKRDENILGIFSVLVDAPRLEALMLYNVDLVLIYVGQDLYQISCFRSLDIIVILDCICSLYYREDTEETLDILDTILNKLASQATHIIISSSHSTPSLIECGSRLLDFDQYMWPRLQYITLNLSTFNYRMSCTIDFEHSPGLLTDRVAEPTLGH